MADVLKMFEAALDDELAGLKRDLMNWASHNMVNSQDLPDKITAMIEVRPQALRDFAAMTRRTEHTMEENGGSGSAQE